MIKGDIVGQEKKAETVTKEISNSLFGNLKREIDNGLSGKTGIIPFQYERIEDFIDISKNTFTTIVGETGAGKSTFAQEAYILKPLEWYFTHKHDTSIKLSIIYFGMERKIYLYTAKWISRMIFLEYGRYISVKRILGRKGSLSQQEYDLVCLYEEVLNKWEEDDTFIWFEGSLNPTGISVFLQSFAEKHGKVNPKADGVLEKRTYTPNHPNHIVLIVTDHIGILASEKNGGERKQRLDKFSETMRNARDLYGFSPVVIQQMNRNLSDISRIKMGESGKPKLSDIADSSDTSRDSDLVLALHDPFRNITMETVKDILGFDLKKLRDERGYTFYRSLHILKSSFDANNLDFPLGLNPFCGIFKTLPKDRTLLTDSFYESIRTGEYFKIVK